MAYFVKVLQCISVKCISLVGTYIEHELVAVKEIINLVGNDKHLLSMRPYLSANLIVRQRFLELIKARYKDLLHRFTLTGTELHIIVKESQDIVMHAILLTKIEIETVPEYLRSSIREKMLRNKNDERELFLPASSETLVGFLVRRQKNLAQERHDDFSLPAPYFTEMEALFPADDPL
jgi:hypothetical protein